MGDQPPRGPNCLIVLLLGLGATVCVGLAAAMTLSGWNRAAAPWLLLIGAIYAAFVALGLLHGGGR